MGRAECVQAARVESVIGPKVPKPTRADEIDAYEACTLRDFNSCVRCRFSGDVQRDHRKGRGVGGRTTVDNLHLLCGPGGPEGGCHLWKGTNPEQAESQGFTVPGWADPLKYPGRRLIRDGYALRLSWVLYSDDGNITEITETDAMRRMYGDNYETEGGG